MYVKFLFKKCNGFILGLLLSLSLISCFEIIEEINLNDNGSGDIIITVNLNQSKNKIASIMLLDSINKRKVPGKEDIQQQINQISNNIKKIKGINNVKSTTDFNNYIFTLNFSFENVNLINSVSKEILKSYKINEDYAAVYKYDILNNKFSRNYKYNSNIYSEYSKMKAEDKEIFKEATYRSIYRFQKSVLKNSNSSAIISKNQKAIMYKCSLLDLINNSVNISNQIQLSK